MVKLRKWIESKVGGARAKDAGSYENNLEQGGRSIHMFTNNNMQEKMTLVRNFFYGRACHESTELSS